MAVGDWSNTAASNTTIGGIGIAPNCDLGNIDNAIREGMKQIKDWYDTVQAAIAGTYQPLDASLTAHAALATAANKGVYYTGSDAPATFDMTAYGRTVAGLANAAALVANLGAVTVTASSLANPGYIHLSNGIKLQWGSGTLGANTSGSLSYSISFTTFAVCTVSGGANSVSVEGNIRVTAASGLSTQSIINTGGSSGYYSWVAVGV